MPSRSFRVQENGGPKPKQAINKRTAVVDAATDSIATGTARRKRRSISLSSGPDLTDISAYESPPTTLPTIDQNLAEAEAPQAKADVDQPSERKPQTLKERAQLMQANRARRHQGPPALKRERQPPEVAQPTRLPRFYY
ncbi:hypothetical protein OEA41_003216 [Lepraria neglecta]|uniref:Uncharacterized protein n=1 Tax=Lepraria neglecta TaxID=209136 RepID=A0AAE0DI47_9LECA|nr:hypothetical protein OEA41_003216 [Lepraria neglecta]